MLVINKNETIRFKEIKNFHEHEPKKVEKKKHEKGVYLNLFM